MYRVIYSCIKGLKALFNIVEARLKKRTVMSVLYDNVQIDQ